MEKIMMIATPVVRSESQNESGAGRLSPLARSARTACKLSTAISFIGIALLSGSADSVAQEAHARAVQPRAAAAAAIDPAAVAAVERMGDYLRTLPVFSIHADTSTDEVLPSGPKIQYGGAIDLIYQAPDRLWMRVANDENDDQQYFYDGTTFSLWIEAKKAWASIPALGSLSKTIEFVDAKYDVTFPLGDLLMRAVDKTLLKDVQAGIVVGSGRIGGTECDHLGFHQQGFDWQLWIEKGAHPLPRKLVITTLDEKSQPQYSQTLTWNLAPKIDAATFIFTPPADSHRIVIAERAGEARGVKRAASKKKEVK